MPGPSLWTLHLLSGKSSPASPAFNQPAVSPNGAREHQAKVSLLRQGVQHSVSVIYTLDICAVLKHNGCGLHVKGTQRPYQLLAGQHSLVALAAVGGVHQ